MVLFLPWLLRVPTQVDKLAQEAPNWMTPATVENLAIALSYWLPVGRVGSPGTSPFNILWLVGVASWLLPLGVAALALTRQSPAPPSSPALQRTLARAAVLGVGTTVLSVLTLWCLARWHVAPVFHGPRYPLLAAGPLAGGLAAAAALARGRDGSGFGSGWLLLTPWLALGLLSSVWGGLIEGKDGLPTAIHNAGIESAYVMPSELIPFSGLRSQTAEWLPIEQLPCDLAHRDEAAVLDLNPWHALDQPRDLVARQALVQGLLGEFENASALVDGRSGASLYSLKHPDRAHAEILCRQGLAHAASPVPVGAGSPALAVDQHAGDGWSFLELGPDLVPRRWAVDPRAKIRFSKPVPAGPATLHLWGSRLPYPAARQPVVIEISDAEPVRFERELEPGRFAIQLELSFARRVAHPVVVIEHSTWSPHEAYGNGDDRRLAYSLEGAWLEFN